MMLSMKILEARQSRNDIDVYLSLLIEYFKVSWEESIDVDDVCSGENFKMCIMLFCSINDFLTYGNFFWYNVIGHKACLICESNTCSQQLHHAKRLFTLCILNFKDTIIHIVDCERLFNGEQEFDITSKSLTGEKFINYSNTLMLYLERTKQGPRGKIYMKK